jgi:hypothetical protein
MIDQVIHDGFSRSSGTSGFHGLPLPGQSPALLGLLHKAQAKSSSHATEPRFAMKLLQAGKCLRRRSSVSKRFFVDDDIAPSTYIASLGFIDYRFDSFDCVIAAKAVPLAG